MLFTSELMNNDNQTIMLTTNDNSLGEFVVFTKSSMEVKHNK